jgi:hypothetical protein
MHTWYESWRFNTKTLQNSSKQENTYTHLVKKDPINIIILTISLSLGPTLPIVAAAENSLVVVSQWLEQDQISRRKA